MDVKKALLIAIKYMPEVEEIKRYQYFENYEQVLREVNEVRNLCESLFGLDYRNLDPESLV